MVLGGIKIASNGKEVSATTHRYTEATLSGAKNSGAKNSIDEDWTGLWWREILNSDERFVQEKYKSITITNTSEPTGAVNEPFYVSVEGDERLKAYYIPNGDLYDCIIYGDCEKIYAPEDSGCLFGDSWLVSDIFGNLETINFECFDTSKTEIMLGMFGCYENYSKLSTIIGLDNFSTSKVTSMRGMFGGCNCLTSLDLSKFDTSSVTDMANMFYSCSSLTSLDLSSFDTSSVTDMSEMFGHCSSLTTLDLSSFDTSIVTDMSNMFYGCSSLTTLDLSSFDVRQLYTWKNIYYGCTSLSKILASENAGYLWDLGKSDCIVLKNPVKFASAGDTFTFDFSKVNYNDFISIYGVPVFYITVVKDDGGVAGFGGPDVPEFEVFEKRDGLYFAISVTKTLVNVCVLTNGDDFDAIEYQIKNDGTSGFGWIDGGWDYEYTFGEDLYVTTKEQTLLNKFMTKVGGDPVEETGIDIYSGLAISGAMLILACGCAVVMNKMK
ncbi:MAG: BspA family leucine-rich repeat surface protein, partial [Clostridiales bacterium]|nr:BspA family leucine-rich repeat surface protein [Candidatus Apopatousia equi]